MKTWRNMEERDKPQITIWRISIACWIPKTTNAHVSICNTYRFSTESMDGRKSLSVTWYMHCLSCWLLNTNISKNKDQYYRTAVRQRTVHSKFATVCAQLDIHSFSILSYDRSKASSKRALHIVRSRASSFKWELDIRHRINKTIVLE